MTEETLPRRTLFTSGGSRGIGLAITLRAAPSGATIAFIAKTDTFDTRIPDTKAP